jgi:hypothetical protein
MKNNYFTGGKMSRSNLFLTALLIILLAGMFGCGGSDTEKESKGEPTRTEGGMSNGRVAPDETYDGVIDGVHLVLDYNAASDYFIGTIENTTAEPVKAIWVMVDLSDGTELGPTDEVDLSPGERTVLSLACKDCDFEWWTARVLTPEK